MVTPPHEVTETTILGKGEAAASAVADLLEELQVLRS
jgi:hypothetical protein